MPDRIDRKPLKGRGVASNPKNRYQPATSVPVDDGWWREEEVASVATVVLQEKSRSIITTNASPDIPFDQSINPYRGCEHGCVYCYARPSHAYWDLSPGLDFETKIIAKPDAPALLRKALTRPGYVCKTISVGANTDPYQPLEASLRTTRGILEVLQEFRHPFTLITKSAMVLRDVDILSEMAGEGLCTVAVSVTTLDNDLKRRLEPRTASPGARLRTIRGLHEAGVPVTLMAAPVIPAINDHELEQILEAGRGAGASSAAYILLRLPLEIADLFQAWLADHYPDRRERVMSLVRQSRGGKDYNSGFHQRMRGEGHFADLIANRFRVAVRKLGLDTGRDHTLDTSRFRREFDQLSLFQ